MLIHHQLPQRLSKRLIILGLIGLFLGVWGLFATPSASADVQFLKEAEQWIYQSQQVLSDDEGHLWQVTALKQMDSQPRGFYLRLLAAPGIVVLDATQPLSIDTASGQRLTAANVTSQYFIGTIPDPNFGQYDLKGLLPTLKNETDLKLQIATQSDHPIKLSIPAAVLDEWKTVGSCEYLICDSLTVSQQC